MISPPYIIKIYSTDIPIISSGVPSIFSTGIPVSRAASVIPRTKISPSISVPATAFLTLSISPAPTYCAIGIAKPCANPIFKPSTSPETEAVAPIAAKASTPRILPTIIVSAIL